MAKEDQNMTHTGEDREGNARLMTGRSVALANAALVHHCGTKHVNAHASTVQLPPAAVALPGGDAEATTFAAFVGGNVASTRTRAVQYIAVTVAVLGKDAFSAALAALV